MRVGAIDHPDRFEDIFNPRYIQEVSGKKITDQISQVDLRKDGQFTLYCHLLAF